MTAGNVAAAAFPIEVDAAKAIPAFLERITVECTVFGTTDPGQQFVSYTLGERLIALDGEFTVSDLRQLVEMMEPSSGAEALAAARWRALLAADLSMMGTAGLDHHDDGSVTQKDNDGYIHAGLNFWTQGANRHVEPGPTRVRAILTAIADQVIAQGGEFKAFPRESER